MKKNGATVRAWTLGVRPKVLLVAVIACTSDSPVPARLTAMSIRLKP